MRRQTSKGTGVVCRFIYVCLIHFSQIDGRRWPHLFGGVLVLLFLSLWSAKHTTWWIFLNNNNTVWCLGCILSSTGQSISGVRNFLNVRKYHSYIEKLITLDIYRYNRVANKSKSRKKSWPLRNQIPLNMYETNIHNFTWLYQRHKRNHLLIYFLFKS